MLNFSRRHYTFLLLVILAFGLVTRLYRLAEPKEYMFDEVYHALTAKLIRHNDLRAYEWWNPPVEPKTAVDWLHPPLAKYTQAIGMDIFGENSFGWRISSAIFGVLVIAATAKLANQLFASKKVALFAAALASLDGLLLVQSRIAMNDIHVTFFILLTLICYLHYRRSSNLNHPAKWSWLFLTGLSAGLAMGSKWSGIYVLITVCLSEFFCWLYNLIWPKKKKHRLPFFPLQTFTKGIFLLLIPCLVYVLSYTQMFLEGKTLFCTGEVIQQGKCNCRQDSSWWVNLLNKYGPNNQLVWQVATSVPIIRQNIPHYSAISVSSTVLPNFWENLEARAGCKRLVSHFSELHQQILYYQTHLTATHPFQSRPYQWFLDLRPVWFWTQNTNEISNNIYSFGNPLLFWFGDVAIILTAAYILVFFVQYLLSNHKKPLTFNFHLILLLVSYSIVWLPWQFSPRIMFFYHYTPAVPFLCIALSYWLVKLSHQKITLGKEKIKLAPVSYSVLFLIFICFIVWYPHWTGLAVPVEFANRIYFALQSWK